jgi:predicted adenine nucleotide alpha hydrolase (AANH) superfamily ATPase
MTGLSVSPRSLRLVTTLKNAFVSFFSDSNLVPLSEKEWVEQRKTEIFSNWEKHQIAEQYKSNSHYSRTLVAS